MCFFSFPRGFHCECNILLNPVRTSRALPNNSTVCTKACSSTAGNLRHMFYVFDVSWPADERKWVVKFMAARSLERLTFYFVYCVKLRVPAHRQPVIWGGHQWMLLLLFIEQCYYQCGLTDCPVQTIVVWVIIVLKIPLQWNKAFKHSCLTDCSVKKSYFK